MKQAKRDLLNASKNARWKPVFDKTGRLVKHVPANAQAELVMTLRTAFRPVTLSKEAMRAFAADLPLTNITKLPAGKARGSNYTTRKAGGTMPMGYYKGTGYGS